MGKPQRITKLATPWDSVAGRLTTKNMLVGATVIGDYLRAEDETRVLVFERPEPPVKAAVARRKHRKSAAQVNENEVAAAASQRDLSKERA